MIAKAIRPAAARWRWLWVSPSRRQSRFLGVLEVASHDRRRGPTRYEVTVPDGDGTARNLVRLVKADGEVYDVVLAGRHGPECTCASWTMGRAHAPTPELRRCKHINSLVSALAGLAEGRLEGEAGNA